MPRYDVFLSHASADKPAVEQLARRLREEGIEPFFDKWHLVPGERWVRGLADALAHSATFAVFIGARSGGGAWRTREVELALDRAATEESFRVIPVLLPEGDEKALDELSKFLGLHTWVDLRPGLVNEAAFRRLVAGIQGRAPGPDTGGGAEPHSLLDRQYRCMAPAREPFVQRREYEESVQALLGRSGGDRVTTVGLTTALQGAGGFGKTALAIELCYDERVREQYPDGILWTTMGEEIDTAGRLARVRDLIRWWTEKDPPAFETVSAASAHLRQELNGKRVLLVVDDVWRLEDVAPFQGFGPRATLLLTTRDNRTLPTDSVPIHVDTMEVPEAVQLLGSGLQNGARVDLRVLATRLGEWPLLLKIVNRQLRELQKDGLSPDQSLQEVNEALNAEGLTAFDREDLESRGQAVAQTVGASLRRLSKEEAKQLGQLAIFPEDKDIPLLVLEKFWGLSSSLAKKLSSRLHDLSLLLRFVRPAGTIRLHDVIRTYLLKTWESQLAEWHRHFLDAYRPASGRWPDLPREESYLWNHLFHHLIGAGESDTCRDLLLDFHYLSSKLGATDVNTLLADYSSFVEEDEEIRLVRDALRLSAHVLARNPTELRGQLLGRLLDRQEERVRNLLRRTGNSGAPWLRPRKASLIEPGGFLIRTIDHPAIPNTLAVLPDGRIVSGANDGTLRVWDVESGKTLQVLKGHSGPVNAVARLGSHRMASGSNDGTLRVWDMESGKALQTLKEDFERVTVVAELDGQRVVSGSDKGTLRVWDIESGRLLQALDGHAPWVSAVAVLDSRRMISGFNDGTLRVWDLEKSQILRVLEGHSSWILSVAVLDDNRVVSGSADGTLRVWDLEMGQTLQVIRYNSGEILSVAVLDDHLIVAGSADGTLRVLNLAMGQALQNFQGHFGEIRSVVVLSDHRIVSSSNDRSLRVWDLGRSQKSPVFEGHSEEIRSIVVLDNHRVVSGSDDQTLRVWDVKSGRTLQVLRGHFGRVRSVEVLDNHRVASHSDDQTWRVWDVESGKILQEVVGRPWVKVMDLLLDSHRVVAGVDDQTLQVWDIRNGQTLKTLEGHSGKILAVAVLDSRRVVSGSSDQTLRVWDVESRKVECLFTLEAPVTAVAVIPDRRIIVAGDQAGRIHFFDLVEPNQPSTNPRERMS